MLCALSVLLLGFLTAIFRLPFVHTTVAYSSDTAILDLMALHFQRLDALTPYYWGGGYYGVLDPLLLIPMFKIFGLSPQTSQGLALLVSVGFIAVYFLFLRRVYGGRVAWPAGLLLSSGGSYFIYTTFATYNYPFAIFFGMLQFILAERIFSAERKPWHVACLGLLMGFSWYYFRLTAVFWVAVGLSYFFTRPVMDRFKAWVQATRPRDWTDFVDRFVWLKNADCPRPLRILLVLVNIVAMVHLLLVAVLWVHDDWIFMAHGTQVKLFLHSIARACMKFFLVVLVAVYWRTILSTARNVWRSPWGPSFLGGFIVGYSPALLGSLLGFRPASPGGVNSLGDMLTNMALFTNVMAPTLMGSSITSWPSLLFAFAVGLGGLLAFGGGIKSLFWDPLPDRVSPSRWFPLLAVANIVLILLLNRLGDAGTARYLLPFFITAPWGFAWAMKRVLASKPLWHTAAIVLLVPWIWTLQSQINRGLSVDPMEELTVHLMNQDVKGGYADYWIAYEITARAQERIILAPTGDNDRFPPYLNHVRQLSQVVLIEKGQPKYGAHILIKGIGYRVGPQEFRKGYTITVLSKA